MDWIAIWTKHKKVILGCVAGLLLLLFILWGVAYIKNWWFEYDLDQDRQAVNAMLKDAEKANANLANAQAKVVEAQANANMANADVEKIKNEANKAQEISNQALANVNAVTGGNYRNTSADDANRARCAAFPDSVECQP